MTYILIALATVGMLVIGLAAVLVAYQDGRKKEAATDLRTFFILGVTWSPLGVALALALHNPGYYGVAVIGLIFLAIGLASRSRWKQLEANAETVPPSRSFVTLGVLIGFVLVLILGGLVYWLTTFRLNPL